MEVSAEELQAAVVRNLNRSAKFVRAIHVTEMHEGKTVWDGIVHVFDVGTGSDSDIAYAWTSAIEGSTKRRFYTVLGKPPINSAADAVRAAIVAEHKGGSK